MRRTRKMIVLMLITVLCVVAVAGCKKDNKMKNLNEVVLTINDKKLTLQDMMYSIYLVEYNGALYGTDWDEEVDGVSNRDYAKSDVIEMEKWYEILYQKAVAADYQINEEEITENKTTAIDMLDEIDDKKEKELGITNEYLMEKLEKESIVLRYYYDTIATYEVDEETIKADLSVDDYRQYEIEYIYGGTQEYDEDFNVTAYSKEQIALVQTRMAEVLLKAKAGEALDTLVSEEDEVLSYGSEGVLENDEYWDAAVVEATKTLKNGEVYQTIIEAQDGFYLIKMINDTSTAAYEEAVQEEVSAIGEAEFDTEYEKMLASYDIVVNEKVWADVVMGAITITETGGTEEDGSISADEEDIEGEIDIEEEDLEDAIDIETE